MQKTLEKTEFGRTSTLTVDVVDGLYCYAHIEDSFSPVGVRITPPSVLKEYGAELPPRQQELYDISSAASIADYCERMKDHVPSAEEQFEMRAAFGEGETVVNVFTGKKYIT